MSAENKCARHDLPNDILRGVFCEKCGEERKERQKLNDEAMRIVKPAPGWPSHIVSWTKDKDCGPFPVGYIEGFLPYREDAAVYSINDAAQAASGIAHLAAGRAAKEIGNEDDETCERERKLAYATAYAKVFGVAFDAALAEILNEYARVK